MPNYTSYTEQGNSLSIQKPKIEDPQAQKQGLMTGAQNTLSWTSTGAQLGGPIGAGIGAVAGIASGVFAARKANKEHMKAAAKALDRYSNQKAALQDNFSNKLDAKAAAENGDYFKNKYENMKTGGKLDNHPDVARTMAFIESSRAKKQKMQQGSKVNIEEKEIADGKVLTLRKKHNEIKPGGSAPKNENYVYEPMNEEGIGTLYRFSDGFNLSDTPEMTQEEQYKKLQENNFRDAFSNYRRDFLKKYVAGDVDNETYQIQEDGKVILRKSNTYLGDINKIQKAQYRKDPRTDEELYQMRNAQFLNSLSSLKNGGVVDTNPDVMLTMAKIEKEKQRRKVERIYRSGGSINIIPKGVTHEEKNNIGDQGIPIVSKDGKRKIAEIELNELTLNDKTTKKVEGLVQAYRETEDPKVLEELGNFVKVEVNENTIDNQGELL